MLRRLLRKSTPVGGPQSTSSEDGARLRRANERQALLIAAFNSLDQGIVICDNQGDIVFTNRFAEALLSGNYQDALAAKALNEVIELARARNFTERAFELFGPPKRSYSIRTVPLYVDAARRDFVAVLEDISNKKHLDDVRRDFVANVSHELKTPIGAVALLAETMSVEEDAGVLKRLSARIEREALRLNRIVDDLLDLSRIESEDHPTLEPVSLDELLAEAVNRIAPSAEIKGVAIETHALSTPLTIHGDRRQLTSAIYNLLDNAVKYTDPGKTVSLAARRSEDELTISIADEGIGIPSRDLERIFERFYRVDQNRSRATGGTGLGLSIVRHVVNNHRGKITVESTEGIGSIFSITLPLYRPEET